MALGRSCQAMIAEPPARAHRLARISIALILALLALALNPPQVAHADPIYTGTWRQTGDLSYPRRGHTATLLQNGKVLVAGGMASPPTPPLPGHISAGFIITDTAELYDPAMGTWTTTGDLNVARRDHTATLLPNGKVLVVGGGVGVASTAATGIVGPFQSAELYDPDEGTWTTTGDLNTPRLGHTATLLPNGKVLVAAGIPPVAFVGIDPSAIISNTAELYDPDTGTWSYSGLLNTGRYGHTATLLTDGNVLVVGGSVPLVANGATPIGLTCLNSAEIYFPETGTWSSTGSLNVGRSGHTATLLADGKVLAAGGSCAGVLIGTVPPYLDSAEVYDPGTGTWSNTASLRVGRSDHTATLLENGMVLVAGGVTVPAPFTIWTEPTVPEPPPVLVPSATDSAEVYDPHTGTWVDTSSLRIACFGHTATLLRNGEVLVAGGVYMLQVPNNNLSHDLLFGDGVPIVPYPLNTADLYEAAQVALTGAPEPFCPGYTLYYTLMMTNTTDTAISNLVISDTLPALWTCCPVDGPGTMIAGAYDLGSNTVVWDLSALGVDQVVRIELELHSFTTTPPGETVTNTFVLAADKFPGSGQVSLGMTADDSACAPVATPTHTPTPTNTPTSTPTPTPTSTPTPTPTPTPRGFFCLPVVIKGS